MTAFLSSPDVQILLFGLFIIVCVEMAVNGRRGKG